jgi:hypothetical protein
VVVARRRPLSFAVVICLCIVGSSANAEDKSGVEEKLSKWTKSDKITLENKAYLRYWYEIQDSDVQGKGEDEPHDNSFELWRYYFGIKAQVAPWLKARFTVDVGKDKAQTSDEADGHTHETPGDPRYGLYAKYAWLEAKLAPNLYLKAGILGNFYHALTDKLWGYRFVFKNIGDEEKLWNSADIGVTLRYQLPAGIGDLLVGAVNGSGYKKALDIDGGKNLWAQAWLYPLAPLGGFGEDIVLGAYLDYALTFADDEDQLLFYSALVGYKSELITLAYQFVGQQAEEAGVDDVASGMGHGAYFRLDTPWKVGLLGRYVMWDEDTSSVAVRTKQQIVAGLSYTPISLFSVALSGTYTSWSKVDGDPMEEEIRLLVSTLLKF